MHGSCRLAPSSAECRVLGSCISSVVEGAAVQQAARLRRTASDATSAFTGVRRYSSLELWRWKLAEFGAEEAGDNYLPAFNSAWVAGGPRQTICQPVEE